MKCNFLNNRAIHSLSVAKLMAKFSHLINRHPEDMFLLGYIHDIGYAIGGENSNHNLYGGKLLMQNNYPYSKEILNHGIITDYNSDELTLLNICDMSVNSKGEIVTFENRKKDIAERYGINSKEIQKFDALRTKIEKTEIYKKIKETLEKENLYGKQI